MKLNPSIKNMSNEYIFFTDQTALTFRICLVAKKNHSLYFRNRLMCKLLLHCLPSTSGKSQVENVDGGGFSLTVCKLCL